MSIWIIWNVWEFAHRRVKQEADFNDLAGLIIPGGESSCIARLLNIFEIKKVCTQRSPRRNENLGHLRGRYFTGQKGNR